MSIIQSLKLAFPIMLLSIWILLAVSFDFLSLDITGGWQVVPNSFLFGFLLLPEILLNLALWGSSFLL